MKKLFAFAALLTLTGCQPPTYNIVVKRSGEAIVISGQGDESWPFGWKNDTINAGLVSIYDREGHGWSIYLSGGPGCDPGSKTAPFPLTYGKLPRCFSQKKPADPIRPGVAYKVEAGASLRMGQGAFRLEASGAITALSATAMGVDGQEWPPQANPNYLDASELNGTAPDNSLDNAS